MFMANKLVLNLNIIKPKLLQLYNFECDFENTRFIFSFTRVGVMFDHGSRDIYDKIRMSCKYLN